MPPLTSNSLKFCFNKIRIRRSSGSNDSSSFDALNEFRPVSVPVGTETCRLFACSLNDQIHQALFQTKKYAKYFVS